MAEMIWGRHTANLEAPCALFLIGMRVNRLLAIGQWVPVARAMGSMLTELGKDPGSGFLSARTVTIRWVPPCRSCEGPLLRALV